MENSPTFSRGWLCTEEPAGCSGLRGRLTGRRDSSLHLYPRSSGGLRETEMTCSYIYTYTLDISHVWMSQSKYQREIEELTFWLYLFR